MPVCPSSPGAHEALGRAKILAWISFSSGALIAAGYAALVVLGLLADP